MPLSGRPIFPAHPAARVVQRRTGLIDRILRELHGRLARARRHAVHRCHRRIRQGRTEPPFRHRHHVPVPATMPNGSARLELLYVLWDAGLDVGYSVRTTTECVSLARQDIKIRTSLLESRLIAGDPALYRLSSVPCRSDVFYWKPADFVTQKLAERNAMRQKYGGSIYLREPNIKEGAGGLRDVHTALWISFVHFKVSLRSADLVGRRHRHRRAVRGVLPGPATFSGTSGTRSITSRAERTTTLPSTFRSRRPGISVTGTRRICSRSSGS